MGNAQKLGERVATARKKLSEDKKMQSERYQYLQTKSPETMQVMMESIATSFENCSPFLEPVLLTAFQFNPEKCKKIVLNCCKNVLSSPIIKDEYEWFKQYVFPSSLWMMKSDENSKYMFEELLDITNEMSQDINNSMNSIYDHLQVHKKWNELISIENKDIVSRQDDKKVGLLQEKGIRQIVQLKEDDDDKEYDTQTFIDSNLAVNILSGTAKKINNEFQTYIQHTIGHYGNFAQGPLKKVERCVSKLENDYQHASFPKAAKLLDLIRCSVTFNTLDQLLIGYNVLMKHIERHQSVIELARIKNGFLDKDGISYRDIKINVIYKSQLNVGMNQICEIQLLLSQYLNEKKRIHKLYSVSRQKEYFQMIVQENDDKKKEMKDVKNLKLVQILNVNKEVQTNYDSDRFFKCSVDSELQLLCLEGSRWFGCIDMNEKNVIFEQKLNLSFNHTMSRCSHDWIIVNEQKYLSIQTTNNSIKFFKICTKCNTFQEDKSLSFSVGTHESIRFSEFDRKFENIVLIINHCILQKRAIKNINEVLVNIKLDENIGSSGLKLISLSNDGNLCAVSGADHRDYFYLINIKQQKQHKLISKLVVNHLTNYAPCFINGDNKYLALGGMHKIEIWDIAKKVVIKTISIKGMAACTASTNNILGVASWDKKLILFDVTTWKPFKETKIETTPRAMHLTQDLKYVTIGGMHGEKCVVFKIQ